MTLFSFGINHKTAPIEIREQVAFSYDELIQAQQNIIKHTSCQEAAILSTCNRTEIYTNTENPDEIMNWVANFHNLSLATIQPYLYQHHGQDCIQHMFKVASGLDSMVLGEPQILGQLKEAERIAAKAATLGKNLNRLFQHAFRVAKQVRTDTEIGSSPVSVAFAAVSLAKQIFGRIDDKTVMLVGAGETVELVAKHLSENQIGRMIVANRSLDKAYDLAQMYGGIAVNLTDMSKYLHEADILISSTASPIPVVGKGTVESALKKRKHRPIFMVDIAVPRDIEPEINHLPDVFLYTVDDLKEVIQQNMQSRQNAVKQAEEIIDIQVLHFWDWLESQHSISTIQHYRKQAHQIRENLLGKAYHALDAGKDPEEVIEILARRLTNQLLHDPCSQLRQSKSDDQKHLIKAAQTLFNIRK